MASCRQCGLVHAVGPCPRPLPRRVDRYELFAVLGGGTFGAVYSGRHTVTGENVAVKVLRRAAHENPEETSRLIAEARAMSAIRDPHVVRVLDAGVASETAEAFVVMELDEGLSLQALVERGPLPPMRAIRIAQQMLEGLAAVHARGIVHRDVKPSNVLVSLRAGQDFVRLLDFGISKVPGMSLMTRPGSSMGTPGFMAPELFGDAAGADARADLYGVAATLYYLLSGRMPFHASSYEDLVVKVRTERPAPLASVAPSFSPSLAAVVDRGLARDRDARWPDAVSFAAALGGAAASVAYAPTIATQMPHMPHMPRPFLDTGSTGAVAPPTARSAGNSSGSWTSWVFGMILGALVLGLAATGGFFVMRARAPLGDAVDDAAKGQSDAVVVAPATPSSMPASPSQSPSPPHAHGGGTLSTTATATPAPTPGKRARIAFGPPELVGAVGLTKVIALTARATPIAQLCPVGAHTVVKTALFVQADGSITLAEPASDNTGDPLIASCVGEAFQEAARSGFKPNAGGIVTVTATVDP